MLSTKEVAELLESANIKLIPEQIAQLARNGTFPNASKDESGKWQIPTSDIADYIKLQKQRKTRIWFTAGTITLAISICGLLSITKDTLDLISTYILPKPTETATPAPPVCTIVGAGDGRCAYFFESPGGISGDEVACLPDGTKVEVVRVVPGIFSQMYQVSSYVYDLGPLKIIEIQPESPAQETGLEIGDIILAVDDVSTKNQVALNNYTSSKAGEKVKLYIERNGKEMVFEVIPRINPPEGQGRIGFKTEGGITEGGEGYVNSLAVSCTNSRK